MSLISVDHTSCTKCGICAAICPTDCIQVTANFPISSGKDDSCINCGHCVAICPHEALQHKAMKPDQCPPLREDLCLDPEQAGHFLRSRRSARNFKDRSIAIDVLKKLINIASFAPSGHNSQSLNWLIVYNRKKVQELEALVVDWMKYLLKNHPEQAHQMRLTDVVTAWEVGRDRILRSAPHIIIVHAENNRFGPYSAPIALTYLELAATSFGLGTCWAGYLTYAAKKWPPLRDALNLPLGHDCFGAMMVGYPKYKFKRIPLRNIPVIRWC